MIHPSHNPIDNEYLTCIFLFVACYLAAHSTAMCGWFLSGSILYKEELDILLCFCCAWELDDNVVCDA